MDVSTSSMRAILSSLWLLAESMAPTDEISGFLVGSTVSPVKIGSQYSTRDSGGLGAAILAWVVSCLMLLRVDRSLLYLVVAKDSKRRVF